MFIELEESKYRDRVEGYYVEDTIDKFLDYTTQVVKNYSIAACSNDFDCTYDYEAESEDVPPPPRDSHMTTERNAAPKKLNILSISKFEREYQQGVDS